MSPKSRHLLDGRFTLDARIGEGTFAEIYRATDTQTGSLVAIKTLRPEHTVKQNAIALFRQEGEIGSSLSHANVVKVWTYGETAGTYFIVMELVTGISLRRRMRRSESIPISEAFRIIRAVLRGLEAIHSAGYIHRDIKPQNILLEANGTPKITDFGITLRAGGIRAPGDGMTLGTAAYIAPEQAAGWEIGPQADLYAAGVVLYEMLTGQVPFPGDDPIEVMHRHMFEAPRDPRALNPEISPALSAVVLRALAKEPDARFPSAQAMHDALEMLHHDSGATVARPARNRRPNPPAPRRKQARIAKVPFLTSFVGALLLAVLIIVLALALVSSAVTANDSTKNISSSGDPSGFTIEVPTATSTPRAQTTANIHIPVPDAPTRPPDLYRFDNIPVNETAQVSTPTSSPTAQATSSSTPKATASATPKPTATATPKPSPAATPDTQVASAQDPSAPIRTDSADTTKKPQSTKHDDGGAQADAANKQNDNANSQTVNHSQPTNSGFGATKNVTNKPDQSSGNPVVSNNGQGTIISGQNNGPSNAQPGGGSGGSGTDKHHHGHG